MKNWIARLFGVAPRRAGSPADQAATPASAPAATPEATPAAQSEPALSDPGPEVDRRFYCWLAGNIAHEAAPATEALILAELARLARSPAVAAELVPRVPAVIPDLLRSLRDEDVSGADIARLVAQDVVLVGEVIREANSSWYRPPTPVRTIDGALILLGRNGLRMLLARVAFRPVLSMQPGRFAKQVAPPIWRQSEKCALAASTLAPTTGADPFEAFLAGLVQNVGLIVAFRLIDQVCHDAVLPASGSFVAALFEYARRMAHGIALHWEFPETVAGAILEGSRADATPLAQVLATGDRLAKLRLLVDAGAMAPDDPAVAAIVGTRLRPCYDRLADQPGTEDD
ncbi:HDOD domain-containing protein [Massilia sp. YIM B02769]|uniref:HDOD domain-containing protein n=1 Tax=unclassified Massilia TaxID=2609279 RepID=UPI0025B63FA0|nr:MULTISPECIES: HDOD domain-containing protein [unclassified Massilia]MDN4060916.1 HDOD domain-containing protein [Massilia sp. YIM B02769]